MKRKRDKEDEAEKEAAASKAAIDNGAEVAEDAAAGKRTRKAKDVE